MVDRLIRHILGHDGIWFARPSEVAVDFRKRQGTPADPQLHRWQPDIVQSRKIV